MQRAALVAAHMKVELFSLVPVPQFCSFFFCICCL